MIGVPSRSGRFVDFHVRHRNGNGSASGPRSAKGPIGCDLKLPLMPHNNGD